MEKSALVLFVANNSPDSLSATANIKHALAQYGNDRFALEVVDVFHFPERAVSDRVIVTPTLLAPGCGRRVIGDLANESRLQYFIETLPESGAAS